MYSSPRWQWARMPQKLLCVPVGTKRAASKPSISAICACSALTLGSSPNTSSPSGAASMASRIAAVGRVTVSLRRSTRGLLMVLLQEVLEHGVAVLREDRLGMELHALDAHRLLEAGVAHTHDL